MAGPDDEDARRADGPLGFGDEPTTPWAADTDATGTPPKHDPQKYAHRQDPDLAAYGIGPGQPPVPPRMAPGTSRYTWFVGVVAVLLIAYVSVNSITTKGRGSRGVSAGEMAPPFAAPRVQNGLGDNDYVNVAARPNQSKGAGKHPACSIHRADVLTSCALYAEKPAVLAFVATRGSPCSKQLDTLQQVVAHRTDVNVAAITIRSDRSATRKFVNGRGWTFPVAYDRDGVLSTLYNVVVCPEITYIAKGGRVAGTSLGDTSAAQVAARIDDLVAGRRLPVK